MRPVIYQLFVRHFSNMQSGGVPCGSREQNGCGTFNGVNEASLRSLAALGVTHVWLTGVLRHATQTAHPGLPADPPCVVKGVAGSPYAVTDYYDVDPDLAEEPEQRLEEFCALLRRCRRCGLIPMMDFIPNHLSRAYCSRRFPERAFGAQDDPHRFFARDNAFFYLQDIWPERPMQLPEGEFVPERGRGRVTGNNVASWHPDACDWYETVKLNYGCDYTHGAPSANALPGLMADDRSVPRTWLLMNEVLAYWQGLGVGGFRCDMAHMVPPPFWRWLIARSRLRDAAVLFVAEGYDDAMSLAQGAVAPALLAAGFDAVYDSRAYERLRAVYERGLWANELDAVNNPDAPLFCGGLRYLENHDEPRLSAPQYWGGQGTRVQAALSVMQFASTRGPVLLYNGQELAESCEAPGGYGGGDGRTSIFDYTYLPHVQRWYNGGACDGAELSPEMAARRKQTGVLLRLLRHPALSQGSFYGLNWANRETPGYGRAAGEAVSGHYLCAFLRHDRSSRTTVLAVVNLSPELAAETRIHIPLHAQAWAGKKPGGFSFVSLTDEAAPPLSADSALLDAEGLPVCVAPGEALLLEWL